MECHFRKGIMRGHIMIFFFLIINCHQNKLFFGRGHFILLSNPLTYIFHSISTLPSFWVGSFSINLFVLDLLLIITRLNKSRQKNVALCKDCLLYLYWLVQSWMQSPY